MKINYKRELESAAKSMIMVHDPESLMKMIVRTLVQKVKVSHAGILLKDQEKDTYVLNVSRGAPGHKIPKGFLRTDAGNPLISFFIERHDKKIFKDGAIVFEEAKKTLRKDINAKSKELLNQVMYQMEIFGANVCIPAYFGKDLLGILLLGKKTRGKTFGRDEMNFFVALASDVAMAIKNAQLFKELNLQLYKKQRLFIHTTIALAAAIDAKDHYTHGHTARVTNISMGIARKLSKTKNNVFDEKFLENLNIAALLHDIGKIGIPERILNKEGPLTDEERKKIQEHPSIGESILKPITELKDSILGIKYHHEKYDGTGYPEGLKGEEIPLNAAIIAVADTFDAMTTDRPYRRALSKKEAKEVIRKQAGRQFNPQISSVFVELFEEGGI
ncbi:HD-GYP domain-containing protein [Candidatus Omnitrophota bacterium]